MSPPFSGPQALNQPPSPAFVRKQGAWGLSWLCLISFGIYYFIWYDRINRELSAVLTSAGAR